MVIHYFENYDINFEILSESINCVIVHLDISIKPRKPNFTKKPFGDGSRKEYDFLYRHYFG